jgi:hypothetical protein
MGSIFSSSSGKYYLSGIDWVISAFDYTMRKKTCSGNASQIVLELDSLADPKILENRLRSFTKMFPVLSGKVARSAYNFVPYWRIPEQGQDTLSVKVHYLNGFSSNAILSFLEKSINSPFHGKHEHIAFQIIQVDNNKSYLTITFDHRLFDAHGAEAFLDLFREYLIGSADQNIFQSIHLTSSPALTEWRKKFHAGQNVNRKFIKLSTIPFDSLSYPSHKNNRFKFNVVTFSQQETKMIYDNAYHEAGYFIEMSYLLAAVIRGVRNLFKKRGTIAANFLIGISVDRRTREEKKQKMFFNHWSYLFIQIDQKDMQSMQGLVHTIKQQIYDQIKTDFTGDIAEASFLFRIVPMSILGKWLGKKMVSFVFSYMSRSLFLPSEFAGTKVENLFHMPRIPVPPGLGFFFNNYNEQLNFVISYVEGLIQDDEIVMLGKNIRDHVLSVHSQERKLPVLYGYSSS